MSVTERPPVPRVLGGGAERCVHLAAFQGVNAEGSSRSESSPGCGGVGPGVACGKGSQIEQVKG